MSNLFKPDLEDQKIEKEYLEYEDESNEKKKKMGAASWVLSSIVHMVIIASLLYMVIPREKKIEDRIIKQSNIEEDTHEEPVEKVIEMVKEKTEVVVNEEVTLPVIESEEVPNEIVQTENDMVVEAVENISEVMSNLPMTGSNLAAYIGGSNSGNTGGGAFGQRSTIGRKKSMIYGCNRRTETSVDLALAWLAEHQEADGHWSTGKWEGDGKPETDMGASGAALLAFLGAGHTDKNGKYKKHVRLAIKWILDHQNPDGSFDGRNYANGICTMAIAEATGMGCGGSEMRKATEMAVDYLLKQQNDSGAYNYTKSSRDDMSVTGWCIMGLKSALLAGVRENDIKAAFLKCGDFFDSLKETTGDNSSTTKGMSWYTSGGAAHPWSACGAIAMLVRQYLGWKRSEPWLVAATNGQVQANQIPKSVADMNVYRVYYAFLALFQQGGDAWKTWNNAVSEVLVRDQRLDGDFKGSWDNNGKGHMKRGGRVLTTAFLCLSLEVYYRYKTITQ